MGSKYAGNKGLEYYKAYPRDFFEGTIGMAGPLRGFYRMVIDLVYMHDGFLLNDWGHISGHTGFGKTQCKRMMQQLIDAGKIELCGINGEFFTQKRAKSELKDSRKFQENQSNNAVKGWENRHLADEVALPEGMPESCHHKTTRPQDPLLAVMEGKNLDEKPKPAKKSERQEVIEILGMYATDEAARSFVDYRAKLKKPVTITAAKRIAKQLKDVEQCGGDATDALGMCEERGWSGFKADWYFNSKKQEENGNYGQFNNNGNQSAYNVRPAGRQNGASGAHAGLIEGLADNAARYARGEGSDDNDDKIPM